VFRAVLAGGPASCRCPKRCDRDVDDVRARAGCRNLIERHPGGVISRPADFHRPQARPVEHCFTAPGQPSPLRTPAGQRPVRIVSGSWIAVANGLAWRAQRAGKPSGAMLGTRANLRGSQEMSPCSNGSQTKPVE